MIHTIETLHPSSLPPAERVPRMWAEKVARVPWETPKQLAPRVTVAAEVNQGRWLARCAFCPGAELVSKDDPRFWCCSCQNQQVGGLWIRVVFPKQHAEIEALLVARPDMGTRSWTTDQTVAELGVENAAHGIGY